MSRAEQDFAGRTRLLVLLPMRLLAGGAAVPESLAAGSVELTASAASRTSPHDVLVWMQAAQALAKQDVRKRACIPP